MKTLLGIIVAACLAVDAYALQVTGTVANALGGYVATNDLVAASNTLAGATLTVTNGLPTTAQVVAATGAVWSATTNLVTHTSNTLAVAMSGLSGAAVDWVYSNDGDLTLHSTNHWIRFGVSNGKTLTFPAASAKVGQEFFVWLAISGTDHMNLASGGGNFITMDGAYGGATITSITPVKANSVWVFVSDGANWWTSCLTGVLSAGYFDGTAPGYATTNQLNGYAPTNQFYGTFMEDPNDCCHSLLWVSPTGDTNTVTLGAFSPP
jgi:hypothetical protein